jgi:hypothetical protein
VFDCFTVILYNIMRMDANNGKPQIPQEMPQNGETDHPLLRAHEVNRLRTQDFLRKTRSMKIEFLIDGQRNKILKLTSGSGVSYDEENPRYPRPPAKVRLRAVKKSEPVQYNAKRSEAELAKELEKANTEAVCALRRAMTADTLRQELAAIEYDQLSEQQIQDLLKVGGNYMDGNDRIRSMEDFHELASVVKGIIERDGAYKLTEDESYDIIVLGLV